MFNVTLAPHNLPLTLLPLISSQMKISCKETHVFKNSHPTFEANACLSYFELQFTQGVMASLKLWPED